MKKSTATRPRAHRLLLLRHAKSDHSEQGMRDHERPLNARGREAAPRMGAYLREHGLVPDLAVVSTATRTRETWALVAQAFKAEPPTTFEQRIYEASMNAILRVIAETPPEIRALLVVGHNPGLQGLAIELSGSGDAHARRQIEDKFPTAGLVLLDFAVENWNDIRAGEGWLVKFVSPRGLDD